MVNALVFIYRLIKLLVSFKLYYIWITTTTEGGLYLKKNLLTLGIIGIKFGQFLYTRHDILSQEAINTLEPLLSCNTIHSYEDTINMLSYDKTKYSDNIQHIETTCLGSGSLAQVHMCYMKDQPNVKYVLKVAHPCIFDLEYELNLWKTILNLYTKFTNIHIDWDSFFKNITVQMDLNNEAQNIKKFYSIYKNYEKIEIPQVLYSDKYFIIMSYCDGVQMNKLEKTCDQYKLATNLVAACCFHTIYKYNISHGDMHFGNILVKPNGYICLIDFGICNYDLSSKTEDIIKNELLFNYRAFILEHDITNINVLLFDILKLPPHTNIEIITQQFISYVKKNNRKESGYTDINLYFMNLLFEFCNIYNLQINGEAVYFILQLVTLEAFAYCIPEIYNGQISMRTLSYMKTDYFFMNEMGEFILKFYNLEYENETEYIQITYP